MVNLCFEVLYLLLLLPMLLPPLLLYHTLQLIKMSLKDALLIKKVLDLSIFLEKLLVLGKYFGLVLLL